MHEAFNDVVVKDVIVSLNDGLRAIEGENVGVYADGESENNIEADNTPIYPLFGMSADMVFAKQEKS